MSINPFKIEKNRGLIIIFVTLSTLVFIGGSAFVDTCRGGMGCVVLLPFYAVGFPALPFVSMIKSILVEVSYGYYSLSNIPSFIQFIPLVLISLYSFLLGFIAARITLKVRSKNELPEEYASKVKHLRKKFISFYFLILVIVCGYVFLQNPPVPFASSKAVAENCGFNYECIPHFIHSKVANCNNETKAFIFPIRTSVPKRDSCLFENFINNNPFSKFALYQLNKEDDTSPMARVLAYFDNQIKVASEEKKLQFCNSFYGEDIRQSNRDYCITKLNLKITPDVSDSATCLAILIYQQLDSSRYALCQDKLVGFTVYNPYLTALRGVIGYMDGKISLEDRIKNRIIPDKYDFIYSGQIYMGGPSKYVKQMSVHSGVYNDFVNSLQELTKLTRYRTKIPGDDAYYNLYYERQKINKYTVNNQDIYIEYVKIGTPENLQKGEVTNELAIAHFVKGETYIMLSTEYNKNISEKAMEYTLTQTASDFIKE
ncbi:MAG: hypothetical protein NTV02_00245 [Candidatus Zambryskibacteria bacterium]|nr:hypothetical protein [Candidatus Zambryskibacteria bacterium]